MNLYIKGIKHEIKVFCFFFYQFLSSCAKLCKGEIYYNVKNVIIVSKHLSNIFFFTAVCPSSSVHY